MSLFKGNLGRGNRKCKSFGLRSFKKVVRIEGEWLRKVWGGESER